MAVNPLPDDDPTPSPGAAGRPARAERAQGAGHALRVAAALAVVAALAIVAVEAHRRGLTSPAGIRALVARVQALRWARVAFVGIYAVASALGFPVTPLTLAGGALFGTVQGSLLNWAGEMLGASLAFALGRTLRPLAARALGRLGGERAAAVAARAGGFLGLLRLRAIPVAPFALLNYGAALVGMPWGTFLAATAVGVVPVTVIYTAFASSLVAGVEGSGGRAFAAAAATGAAVVLLSLVPRLRRRRGARRGTPGRAGVR